MLDQVGEEVGDYLLDLAGEMGIGQVVLEVAVTLERPDGPLDPLTSVGPGNRIDRPGRIEPLDLTGLPVGQPPNRVMTRSPILTESASCAICPMSGSDFVGPLERRPQ